MPGAGLERDPARRCSGRGACARQRPGRLGDASTTTRGSSASRSRSASRISPLWANPPAGLAELRAVLLQNTSKESATSPDTSGPAFRRLADEVSPHTRGRRRRRQRRTVRRPRRGRRRRRRRLLARSVRPRPCRLHHRQHPPPGRRCRGALDEPRNMSRRSTRKISPNQRTRADLIYPRSLHVLEPGRTRRHPMPRLARMLWGVAVGFASAMLVTGLLAWLG